MPIMKRLSIALFLALFGLAAAAQPAGDQVDQLDQLVNLNDDQKKTIRDLIAKSEAKTEKLRIEAQQVQQALSREVGPGYDEDTIRKNAEELGRISGDLTAENVLLQARIQSTLTDEQRDTLARRIQEMQQMQQQLQQQQQQ